MTYRYLPGPSPHGRLPASLAFVTGMAYAAVSAYWGLGGTGMLDTVGGDLATEGRAGSPAVFAGVWGACLLKVVGSVLPLMAVGSFGNREVVGLARWFSWVQAVVLTGYGFLLTFVGLLVQAEVISASSDADLHALAWHTFLWDPWFLLWGLLVTAALVRSRPR